jgi:AcrR family transcriptional regulator
VGLPDSPGAESTRRTEILTTAEALFATHGLRTSLQDIADAAGILAGSLYHHFESKESIFVELLRNYHADLDRVGSAAQAQLDDLDAASIAERISTLGAAIANTAVRHRTALQMSFYEAPSEHPDLVALVRHRPTAVQDAMLQTLRAGKWSGYIRSDIDLPMLADRMCQSFLHIGLDVIRNRAKADQVAAVLSRIMLDGLSPKPYGDEDLDSSNAFAAADDVITSWADGTTDDPQDKSALVRGVARKEFGRKGYELTTIRDIASAAGLGTGTVYRVIGSKEELLVSIMESFGMTVAAGWTKVLQSDSTASEKLDALCWIDVNALERFHDEFRIQLAWMRNSPPNTANVAWQFTTRMRQLKALLTDGMRTGDIRVDGSSKELLSRCVLDTLWIPENIARALGNRKALLLARDTVVRGITEA